MKKIICTVLLSLCLLTGCGHGKVTYLGLSGEDKRLDFEQLEYGITYSNSMNYLNASGYHDGCIITSLEDLKGIETDLNVVLEEAESTDFDQYMILAEYSGGWGEDGWASAQTISEIGYNDELLQVEYSPDDIIKGYSDLSKGKYVISYSMIRINKNEFPYEERDFQGLTVDNKNVE